MIEPILEIQNGTFSYEKGENAICHLDVKIHKGEKIAVVGNNGAGKSTFFLSLNGVLCLEEGNLFYRGERITKQRESLRNLRRHVGMVFQDPDQQMIASTVAGEISFGLFNLGMQETAVREEVGKVMEEAGLTALADRPPHLLSGGEKKRVSIADIVAMNPEVILLDEPTSGLDCQHICIFREQMEKLHQQDVTLLISTHDMDFVWEWADRVLVFCGGEIIADDTSEHIFAQEEILWRAALGKPILYEVANLLELQPYPKSLEQFQKAYLEERCSSGGEI